MDQHNVKRQLSPEQVRALLDKLSTEDKARVAEELRNCSGKVLLERGGLFIEM
jgi:hypothetical protein